MRTTILIVLTLFATRQIYAQNNIVLPPFHYDDSLITELAEPIKQNVNIFGVEYITLENNTEITYFILFNGCNITAYKIYDSAVYISNKILTDSMNLNFLTKLSIKESEKFLQFTPPISFSNNCKTSIVLASKERFMILYGECEYTLNPSLNKQREAFFTILESIVKSLDFGKYYMRYERMY